MLVLPVVALILAVQAAEPPATERRPAITLRLIHPDRSLTALLRLFDDAGVESPAAALARWRAATGNADVLAKRTQTAIAALNPDMVRELAALDGAIARFRFDRDGRLQWHVSIPRDDGVFAAVATALALTDGASESPLELSGAAVDRLDRAGQLLCARLGPAVILGSSRGELDDGIQGIEPMAPGLAALPGAGWIAEIDPAVLQDSPAPTHRAAAAILEALEATSLHAQGVLNDQALTVHLRTTRSTGSKPLPVIDPAWLAPVPDTAGCCFAFALDAQGDVASTLFRIADRLDRARHPNTEAAPLRDRLNTLAAACGLFPDVELWPRLAGFSAWFGLDDSGEPASGALVLHFRDPGTAESFASRLAPRLCRWLGARHEGPGPQERAEDSVHFDRAAADDTGTVVASFRDRPVGVLLHRASLAITWGDDALPATRVSWRRASPELPGGLSTALHAGQYQRLGAIWPGRFTRGAKGLLRLSVDTAPLVWTGSADGQSLEDRVEWANLSETVKSVVDALPRLPDPEPGR